LSEKDQPNNASSDQVGGRSPGEFCARFALTARQAAEHNLDECCIVYRLANGKIQEITEYCDTELITAAFGK